MIVMAALISNGRTDRNRCQADALAQLVFKAQPGFRAGAEA